MYRDCYTMKLAYPCEADGCRCGSDCLRTRPDCNRIADEDSYSNCDVIPHIGLHRSSEYMPQHDAALVSGREGRGLHAATSSFTGIRQCAPKAKELTPRKDGGMRNLGRGGIRRLSERGRDRKFKSCRFLCLWKDTIPEAYSA